jgi:uncharacterized protein YdaU (DUF1376 family)
MKIKRPAFQFYPADYLGSQRVALMSLEEEGAYIRLLCYCWQHGSIPSNPDQIARLIGKGASTTLATTVATMFKPHQENGSLLVHERLEQEILKQNEWARKSAEGGKKSAEMRKMLKGGSTTVARVVEDCLPNGINQKATLQSSSSSSTTNNINKPDSVPEQVWNDFNKIRKAKKAPLTQTALNGIEREAQTAGWTLEDALTECVSRGWQGFKADWVQPKQTEITYQRAC